MLTFEKINSLFQYKDGHLYKKLRAGNLAKKPSGTRSSSGYIAIKIEGKLYLAHRAIYILHHQTLPKYIDHIDGNRSNNHIDNLRSCSFGQNIMNCKKRATNISGHKNVSYRKNLKKWIVEVQENKNRHYLGCFEDFDLACLVADEARNLYHKEFARSE